MLSFDNSIRSVCERRHSHGEGVTVSRWMSDAAAAHLRNRLLSAALDRFEAEDGPFTQEELDRAASLLGLSTAAGAGGDDPRS